MSLLLSFSNPSFWDIFGICFNHQEQDDPEISIQRFDPNLSAETISKLPLWLPGDLDFPEQSECDHIFTGQEDACGRIIHGQYSGQESASPYGICLKHVSQVCASEEVGCCCSCEL